MTTIDLRSFNPAEKPPPEETKEAALTPVIANLPAQPVEGSLDDAVAHINAIHGRKRLEVMLEVGRFVLDRFFEGDPLLVADRGKRQPGFRALAGRGDLQMSHVWLWRAVRVFVQLPILPKEAATRLSSTHHVLLLPIRCGATRRALAERAIAEQMSTRELDDAVREALWLEGPVTRNRRPKRRKPAPTFLKTVRKMGELVDEDGRWHDLRQIGRLKPEEALALFETIRQIEKKCREVRAAQGECCRRAGG